MVFFIVAALPGQSLTTIIDVPYKADPSKHIHSSKKGVEKPSQKKDDANASSFPTRCWNHAPWEKSYYIAQEIHRLVTDILLPTSIYAYDLEVIHDFHGVIFSIHIHLFHAVLQSNANAYDEHSAQNLEGMF